MANYNEQGNKPADINVEVECLSCGKVDVVTCSHYWSVDDEEWFVLGPSYKYRCDECLPDYLAGQQRIRELTSPCPPQWFDPDNAGERWDEE